MKNTITTCCSTLSHCRLALPIQMPSRGLGKISVSWQTELGNPCPCCFAFTRKQHALTFLVKMGKVAMFGLWRGGSDAERLPRLGDALGDLEQSSPVHHSLHSGNAVLSKYYTFQK